MSGPKNTLFNYFKKVSSPSTSVSSPSATPKSTPSTPISQNKKRDEPEKKTPAPSTPVSRNSKSVKKEQEKMDCTGDSQGRKRKRIRYFLIKMTSHLNSKDRTQNAPKNQGSYLVKFIVTLRKTYTLICTS